MKIIYEVGDEVQATIENCNIYHMWFDGIVVEETKNEKTKIKVIEIYNNINDDVKKGDVLELDDNQILSGFGKV